MIPVAELIGSPAEIKAALHRRDIVVMANASITKLQDQVEEIKVWHEGLVASGVGWNGAKFFVLPDRSIQQDPSEGQIFETLETTADEQSAGSRKTWKSEVATPLIGHPIPTFALAFSFMPPILALTSRNMNVLFEYVSPPSRGKTSVQQIAASVWGSPSRFRGKSYLVAMDTTVNGLEATMEEHCDLPIIMDEANQFAAESSPKARAVAFQSIAFKLASGSEKQRFNQAASDPAYRLGFLSSTNDPLSQMLGQGSEAAMAARERLLTIPIDRKRPYGVLESVPEGFDNCAAFIDHLVKTAEVNHGHAGRRFIKHLVVERANDEQALRDRISSLVRRFREEAGIDCNDGSTVRVSEAFGLVYAAGEIAKGYGCLPKKMDVMGAAIVCYRLNRAHDASTRPFLERLAALIDDPRVILWRKDKPNRNAKAVALLYKAGGKTELWIRRKNVTDIWPDWRALCKEDEVKEAMVFDKNHLDTKRRAGKNLKPVRIYVFIVPSAQ